MNKVLIIDDEEKLRTLLSKIISLEGFEVLQAGDGKKALQKLETTNIDVVICDVKLPDGNGVELAKTIKDKYPLIEIILLTAYGNIPDGVQAIKNGAFDYITKGDDNNRIIPLLYKATEKAVLAKRVLQLEKQLGNKHSFENIIGKSKNIKAAIEAAKKVASTDATVLLTGETGTGKEVFAQAMVIFTVYIGTIIMLGVCICIAAGETSQGSLAYNLIIFGVLFITVLFANFAEARGKEQANSLRKTREDAAAKEIVLNIINKFKNFKKQGFDDHS